jgi:hypothetical protein
MKYLGATVLILATLGCINTGKPPATQPASAIDPKTSEPDYWLDQPEIVSVSSDVFFDVWSAAEHALRDRGFEIDRADQRLALMTSAPLVSKQIFEVWRNDVPEARQQTLASLASIRRTVHLDFARGNDGIYRVSPKVLVERFTNEERRITAVVGYETAFSRPLSEEDRASEGRPWLAAYWYAIGRDHELERELAASIERKLNPQ